MRFKNGKEMLKNLRNKGGLYSPEKGLYVFEHISDRGLCYRYITNNEAKQLAGYKVKDGYWNSILGTGWHLVYGDPVEWLNDVSDGEWFDTEKMEVAE